MEPGRPGRGPRLERVRGSTPAEPLLGGGDGTVQAESGAYTTCAPSQGDAGDEYQTPLPQGDYEVRVVAFPQVDGGWGPW
nr:hypothetical protein GCM10025730_28280 [Promicromonospora thailandica]